MSEVVYMLHYLLHVISQWCNVLLRTIRNPMILASCGAVHESLVTIALLTPGPTFGSTSFVGFPPVDDRSDCCPSFSEKLSTTIRLDVISSMKLEEFGTHKRRTYQGTRPALVGRTDSTATTTRIDGLH